MKTFISKSRILVLAFFAMPFLSVAQDGSLDLSFGTGGIVTTSISTIGDDAKSVAIQADGKIVVAGISNDGFKDNFALTRYNIDGSLDVTFNGDGKVTTEIGKNSQAWSVVMQSDGKIVVVGASSNGAKNYFALARYNSNGSLDNSFGTAGKVITAIGSFGDNAYSVAIQADGKIVVAGSSYNGTHNDFALARYNTDGSLDNTFDKDGKISTSISTGEDQIQSVILQPDGKILAAGFSNNSSSALDFDFALVRYNSDGSLDNTFDTDGIVTTAIGVSDDFASALALQSDGKIVVVGIIKSGGNSEYSIVRYNSNGSLDNTFDTDGKVITAIGTLEDIANSVAIQSDGKIVVAGSSFNGVNHDFAIVRYNNDGSLDNTFDTDGKITTHIGTGNALASSSIIQSDGKIVIVGLSINDSKRNFTVVRYNNSSVGINSLTLETNEIKFFPNPSTDFLHIQDAAIGSSIALYDMQGRVLKSEELQSSTPQIDMRQLPKGNYLLRIISPAGDVGSAKVMKE